ncbi:MAG: DUF2147 domain-containing protein [Bacteroidota bacterium]
MKLIVSFFVFLLLSCSVFAQSPIGVWKTVDDEDGEEKSHVRIFEGDDGLIYGEIIKILNEEDADSLCTECKDHRKDKPILGMQVITNMAPAGDTYKKGSILDPNNGKVYRCKLWLDGEDVLMVRGYLGPFFRTQKWYRVN